MYLVAYFAASIYYASIIVSIDVNFDLQFDTTIDARFYAQYKLFVYLLRRGKVETWQGLGKNFSLALLFYREPNYSFNHNYSQNIWINLRRRRLINRR